MPDVEAQCNVGQAVIPTHPTLWLVSNRVFYGFHGHAATPEAPTPPEAALKTATLPAATPKTSTPPAAAPKTPTPNPKTPTPPAVPEAESPTDADDGSESSYHPDDDTDASDDGDTTPVVEESKDDREADVATGDANLVDGSEDPRTYVAFESDAENDDGDDEGDAPEDDLTELDVQLPVPPELRFDGKLIAAVGGMENILSGTVPDELLRDMGEKGWSDLSTSTAFDYSMQPYEVRPANSLIQDYPNLYSGESGPTAKALDAADTPSEYG
ncbi:hypothetical protein PHYSODRAFT_261848 [Phytophthora sojae]|uniref:Uncharacterized protein n=1 Tax=Phytophthora sojae (strain P6497) TaxID=1094619 RepID=G5A0P1_PHYSP|nr:hypothetical protein PHYSODRAFT_261848 [Phytophthora sojae]EGZ10577.1 hypothetical protein PHYSODRAFT_261848 [Phytophthora sojae]|eukprot:XP_009533322.1 hypothetical protein PHYSODRAFT_261848 [Phytophthora sojae]